MEYDTKSGDRSGSCLSTSTSYQTIWVPKRLQRSPCTIVVNTRRPTTSYVLTIQKSHQYIPLHYINTRKMGRAAINTQFISVISNTARAVEADIVQWANNNNRDWFKLPIMHLSPPNLVPRVQSYHHSHIINLKSVRHNLMVGYAKWIKQKKKNLQVSTSNEPSYFYLHNYPPHPVLICTEQFYKRLIGIFGFYSGDYNISLDDLNLM